jgi:hypothetical protein
MTEPTVFLSGVKMIAEVVWVLMELQGPHTANK